MFLKFLLLIITFAVFQKFLFYVLKSSDVLNVLVPILYHLNDSRGDPCKYYFYIAIAQRESHLGLVYHLAANMFWIFLISSFLWSIVDSLISGHYQGNNFSPPVGGVRLFESSMFLIIYGLGRGNLKVLTF